MYRTNYLCLAKALLHTVIIVTALAGNLAIAERSAAIINIGKTSSYPGVYSITGEELIELMDYDEEASILDIRSPSKKKAGVIPFSDALKPSQLSKEFMAENLERKSTVIIIYGDNNSKTAAKAASKTAAMGYNNVFWLKGGWQEWVSKGLNL